MSGVSVSDVDGRVVAVKEAADNPDAEARLRSEADLLSRLDHPGVIELVALEEGPPVRLLTTFVGPDSWARQPPTAPTEIVQRLAMVASIIADLHDTDIAHCSICPEHILTGGDGRPVLCGFADAATGSEEAQLDDGIDLAALIRVVSDRLPEPHREELESVASRLEDGAPTRSATHQLDTLSVPAPAPAVRSRWSKLGRPIPALAVAAIVGVGAVVAFSSNSEASDPVPDQPSTTLSPPATPSPESSTSTSIPPLPASDTEGAPVLVHDGRRYGVGAPGDSALSGDWNCDGTPTPAILRPATGEVAVFDSWPAANRSVAPVLVEVIDGALALEVDTDGGCHLLRARTISGSRLVTTEFP